MKKIIIAVFAVMSAASAASAKGLQINFDGRATDAMTFKEAVKLVQEKSGLACHQVCTRDEKGIVTCWDECTPSNKSAGSDFPAVPAVPAPVTSPAEVKSVIASGRRVFSPEEIMAMDTSIKSAIAYTNSHQSFATSVRFERLLKDGTPEQKLEFVNSEQGSVYRFPNNINPATRTCTSWGSNQVCMDKEVCQTSCVAGAVVCYAVTNIFGVVTQTCGAGAAVCTLVCKTIPVCTSTPVCLNDPAYGPTYGKSLAQSL